jgi:hypothetical protein
MASATTGKRRDTGMSFHFRAILGGSACAGEFGTQKVATLRPHLIFL